jgi:2-dehydro-3-deoxyphosphogluconate aldolase/(4S)-4-hydroxy-2-oxoglutarate aldolase
MPSYEQAVPLVLALTKGGISIVEVTLTGNFAQEAIFRIREALGAEAIVGVGTVLQPEQATACTTAGAEFVVTPGVRPAVVARCAELGVPLICGAFTATEVATALDTGTQLIKLFPARLGGPDHVRDLAGPFPQAKFVPTGGVSAQNASHYLAAGAIAVGMGTSLVSLEAVARQDWSVIETAARAAVEAVCKMSDVVTVTEANG